MSSVRKRSGAWYARWTDAGGAKRELRAGTDKRAAEQLAASMESEASKVRAGLVDPRAALYRDHERLAIADHVAAFRESIAAKGSTAKHADKTAARVARVLTIGRIGRLSQLNLSRVHVAIAALRSEGLSMESVNHYIRAAKGFARWCWKDGRTRDHQLVALSTTSPEAGRTFRRRALTPDEAARLVAAVERGPAVMGLSGPDRAMLYRVALATGLRAKELASLRRESFRLDQTPPMVACEAAYTKNGQRVEQPIPEALASLLRPWLATRAVGRPIFDLPERAAAMLRVDLETADIEAETADGRLDLHSLRVSFITRIVASGASVKVAQTLARHSTPHLTVGVYARASLHDVVAAVESLPDPTPSRAPLASARATGTHGRINNRLAHPLPTAGDGSGRKPSDSVVMALPSQHFFKEGKPLVFSDSDGHSGVLTGAVGTPSRRDGMADVGDLKSPGGEPPCGFDSHRR